MPTGFVTILVNVLIKKSYKELQKCIRDKVVMMVLCELFKSRISKNGTHLVSVTWSS
jgi:hypothetical protein